MKQRIAVIDLGTNTFHLLIVAVEGKTFRTLYRDRRFIKLASDGIEHLGKEAMERGFDALQEFKAIMDGYQVDKVNAVGTAALRTAANGSAFADTAGAILGKPVQVITGEQEATLIYQGIRQVWRGVGTGLIMDIGGGSVEFIIAGQESVLWQDSFPIGVAVLHHRFHRHDPISSSERSAVQDFIHPYMLQLSRQIEIHQPDTLVGASGTFDVLAALALGVTDQAYVEVLGGDIKKYLSYLIRSTASERRADPLIPDSRVDMIVVAALLVEQVLSILPADPIGISSYALKEGLLDQYLDKPK